ncbi:MAG: peptidylprolyl isomerase [Sulfuricellaceae bacterium]
MSKDKISKNKAVYITYSIVDEHGQVFEQMDMPVGYIHRANSGIFEKVENALEGLTIGDRVEVTLTPEEGFGPYQPELSFTDDIDNVPPEFRFVGAEVEFTNDREESMMFKVTRIANGKLTVDGNHPMAGQSVTFVVTVAAIRAAEAAEIANGRPADSNFTTLH